MADSGTDEPNKFGSLEWPDILVIVAYFAIVLAFGIWSSCKNRGSVGGYFLAGRDMHFVLVGASLFASNIGSEHFIGLAGSGAASGIGITVFELNAIFVLMILGWIFVPVYIASGVFTMPEYLQKRFGGQRIRIYLAVLALLLSIFTKVAANLYAGAIFIEQSLGFNLYVAIVILLAIAALFTIAGGLTAVIWTDFIQTIIMLIGAFYLMVASIIKAGSFDTVAREFMTSASNTTKYFEANPQLNFSYRGCGYPPANSLHLVRDADDGSLPWPGIFFGLTISSVWYWCSDQPYVQRAGFIEAGGYENIEYSYMRAAPNSSLHEMEAWGNTTCGLPPPDSYNMVREYNDPDYPWPGMFFGATISSLWYWCSDQVIVQRTLAAKNYSHAKAGCILAGYLKILPMWIIVLPGMISRILYTDIVACATPDECMAKCNQPSGCTNIAYPLLVLNLLPVAARGLMVAVMLSAVMSSLTSIFNSSSTLFTVDIWCRIRKQASDVELMIVGRVFVLFMVGIGIAWIPIVQNFAELFHYVQSVTSYLSPPVCATYLLAVLWKKTNEKGAFWGLMVGLVVGLIRFIWENVYSAPPCGEEDTRPAVISKVHYLHFGIILFGISGIVTIVISLVTQPIDEQYLFRLTYWDRYSKEKRLDINEAANEKDRQKAMERKLRKEAKDGEINPAFTGSQDIVQDSNGASSTVLAEPEPESKKPWYKVAANWICGIEKTITYTDEEKVTMEAKQTSLYEKPFFRKLCNVNAIILCTIATFIWGFFA